MYYFHTYLNNNTKITFVLQIIKFRFNLTFSNAIIQTYPSGPVLSQVPILLKAWIGVQHNKINDVSFNCMATYYTLYFKFDAEETSLRIYKSCYSLNLP